MRTAVLHGVQQGDEDTGTGSADGMAQRNSAAVDVQLALVEVQSAMYWKSIWNMASSVQKNLKRSLVLGNVAKKK